MKIVTNDQNPAALKLLVASELAKKNVPLETIPCTGKRVSGVNSLPLLELDSGVELFAVNQAARFLLPPNSVIETNVDNWLEWDSALLQPAVSAGVLSPGKCDARLASLLEKLDTALSGKGLLNEDGINVSDVCIWATLFPVAADEKLSTHWISSRNNINSWWKKLYNTAAFKCSVQKLGAASGTQGVQNVSSATLYTANMYQHPSPSADNAVSCASQKMDKKQKSEPKGKEPSHSSTTVESGFSQLSISSLAMDGPGWESELQAAKDGFECEPLMKRKAEVKPVLPKSGERNVLVTSALPYVNNVPHLGNIIGCVLSADVFSRYCRLRNYNTLYISGTDEYGTATETKALEEGLKPREICDKYNAIHADIYEWFNINFDLFGRTTIREQTEITQSLFLRLHKLGYTLTEPMEQLLCQKCDRYLADRFVEGTCPKCAYEDARGDQCDGCGTLINTTELIKPRCKLCGDTPVIRNSDQYFLDLPKIEPKLRDWFEKRSSEWSHNARVITKSWLKDGLRPRCITRDLKWGIPVPLDGFRNKVFYVWFDAPIGYMSMTKKYTNKWQEWWQPKQNVKVDYYQFMAKDNVPFHSIMFPSTLLAADEGYTTVSHIMATEYLNYEDGKFSKSRGVGVFGNNARDTGIPADLWRFYLLFVRPESQDSSFSWDDLALRINTELLNNLGNFVNRALMFVEKTYKSTIPEIHLEQDDIVFLALVNRELAAYISCLEVAKLRDGLRHILSVSRHGNQYIQSQQPWVKAKGTPHDQKRASTVVGVAANIACLLAVLLHPYMPKVSQTIQEQLHAPNDVYIITEKVALLLKPGHQIGKPSPLFAKIEPSQANEFKKQFAGKQELNAPIKKAAQAPVSTATGGNTLAVAELQAAVDKQANLVREMKASGKSKAEWQPHLSVLLQLKADLVAAQTLATPSNPAPVPPSSPAAASGSSSSSSVDVANLEQLIKKQGDLVREMKSSGKPKAEWQPEVNKLLALKQQLASLPPPTAAGDSCTSNSVDNLVDVSNLEEAIKAQGDLVRQMKSGGKSKAEWQPEVNKLLALKKQLATLQPSSADSQSTSNSISSSSTSGKSKSKKKK